MDFGVLAIRLADGLKSKSAKSMRSVAASVVRALHADTPDIKDVVAMRYLKRACLALQTALMMDNASDVGKVGYHLHGASKDLLNASAILKKLAQVPPVPSIPSPSAAPAPQVPQSPKDVEIKRAVDKARQSAAAFEEYKRKLKELSGIEVDDASAAPFFNTNYDPKVASDAIKKQQLNPMARKVKAAPVDPATPPAKEEEFKVEFKPTKPQVETPTQVDYLEGDLGVMAQSIKAKHEYVESVVEQGKAIVKAAKAEQAKLEEGIEYQAAKREIERITNDLWRALETMGSETEYVFRQIDNTIFAAFQKTKPNETGPSADVKLAFVMEELKKIDGTLSTSIWNKMHAFEKKMTTYQEYIERKLHMFKKPKKTAQVETDDLGIIQLLREGYRDVSDVISELFDLGQHAKAIGEMAMSIGNGV